jgi:hypothetical protein
VAGRRCTVCIHGDRPAIDQALINHRPFRRIAVQFALSLSAVIRHHDEHLPEVLAHAQAAAEASRADDLLQQLKIIKNLALTITDRSEKAGDGKLALAGIREARACLELLLEVEQRIDRRPVFSLLIAPEWLVARSALIETLRPYPEARAAVAARLVALEGAS